MNMKINSVVATPAVLSLENLSRVGVSGATSVEDWSGSCVHHHPLTAKGPPLYHKWILSQWSTPLGEAALAPETQCLAAGEREILFPLSLRKQQWKAIGAPPLVMKTITKGYRLQITVRPPCFTQTIHSVQFVFYRRMYFLVLKRGGTGICPILDLRAPSKHLRRYKFKMLTVKSLLRHIRWNYRLVHVDRLERWVLSCTHLSSTQEVPLVCLPGSLL